MTPYILIVLSILSLTISGCTSKENNKSHSDHTDLYYCPMHKEVTSDKPGVCPICQMDLVKKSRVESAADTMHHSLFLNPDQMRSAQVTTMTVRTSKLKKTITGFTTLEFAEDLRKTIAARFSGRIEKLYVAKTGDRIEAGQALFEIYSPELVQAQNDFVVLLNNKEGQSYTNQMLSAAETKLRLLGVTSDQLETLRRTREIKQNFIYHSPYSGTVIEKKITEGAYVNEGTILYDMADLSLIWGVSDIFESEARFLKLHSTVTIRLDTYPDEKFTGTITLIYPVIEPVSRTIKVRIEINNKDYRLRPKMYGQMIFDSPLPELPVIPETAVLLTGKRALTWVMTSPHHFEQREIMLGEKVGDQYTVLSGITAGEVIVKTGGYLIDSESQLTGK